MKKYDPHCNEWEYLQSVASSYWSSEILFSALDTQIFEVLQETKTIEEIAQEYHCEISTLQVFLKTLVHMGFICEYKGSYSNTLLSNRYLVKKSSLYQGDFILWIREAQSNWQNLSKILKEGFEFKKDLKEQKQYEKAISVSLNKKENSLHVFFEAIKDIKHIVGIGPGAQTFCQSLLEIFPQAELKSYDEAEVNIQDKELILKQYHENTYDIIFLSNLGILYSQEEIAHILKESNKHVSKNGYIIIYDVFLSEGNFTSTMKSLNRALNTQKGGGLSSKWLTQELKNLDLKDSGIISLEDGSEILFSSKTEEGIQHLPIDKKAYLIQKLKSIGFKSAKIINPKEDVYLTNIAHLKCKYGCEFYNKETCYKECDLHHTKEILKEFTCGILVEGEPPTKDFQISMLQAERQAFKLGYYKAFSLWAGPCSVCDECISDKDKCTKTRPSMENYGIDVFETVHKQGYSLKTLASKDEFVKYYGLLLVE